MTYDTPCSLCGSLSFHPACPRCEMGRVASCDDADMQRFREEERERLRSCGIPCKDYVPKEIALVGCGKLKYNRRLPARDMYRGDLFRKALAYATKTAENVYILSAKYGLIEPHEVIDPYDLSIIEIGRAGRERWGKIAMDELLRRHLLTFLRISIYAGYHYADPFIRAAEASRLPWDFDLPLKHLGIGQRKKWFLANLPEASSAC